MGAPVSSSVGEQRARVARMAAEFDSLRRDGGRALAMIDLVLEDEGWARSAGPDAAHAAREALRAERPALVEIALPAPLGSPEVAAFRSSLPTLTPAQAFEIAGQSRAVAEFVRRSAAVVLDELRSALPRWRRVEAARGAPDGVRALIAEAKALLVVLRTVAGPRA